MCGICGYISLAHQDPGILEKMNATLHHRGPDSKGDFIDGPFHLAMRRLSIIDVAGSSQPIISQNGNLVIIFNGAIYNFRELRTELIKIGALFNTEGDTEVILKGYECWGVDVFKRLNGMFAVAIYDRSRSRVVLARDRLGIKPLYYYSKPGTFLFGSEMKALFAHPSFEKRVNVLALSEIFKYKFNLGEQTVFEDVRQVPPGHYLFISHESEVSDLFRYWDPLSCASVVPEFSGREALIWIRDKTEEAIRSHLVADVPIGIFLSGGIDSAILAAVASRQSSKRISTFSIGFEEKGYNELPLARKTASLVSSDHHEEILRSSNLIELLYSIVKYLDQPLGDHALIPTYLLSKFTAKNVKVVLSGAGADEVFGGYERYLMKYGAGLRKVTGERPIRAVAGILKRIGSSTRKKSIRRRALKYLQAISTSPGLGYDHSFQIVSHKLYNELFPHNFIVPSSDQNIEHYFEQISSEDYLTKASITDLHFILQNDYLIKDDRMGMASSLEVRVPFLDRNLIESSFRVKSKMKLKGFNTKYILRRAFKDAIHSDVLNKPKMGFESPVRLWLKGEFGKQASDLLINGKLVKDGYVNATTISSIFKEHASSQNDHSKIIFTLLTAEMWYSNHF